MRKQNEIIYYDSYAEFIMTKRDYVTETGRVKVSLEDVDMLSQYKWRLHSEGYAVTNIKGNARRMHRLITDVGNDSFVDHINRNRLDNRRENLRVCNNSQNMMNGNRKSNNRSGVTGVSWYNNNNKWVAEITVNGKKINLGSFEYKDDAILARFKAEEKYFGEFAPKSVFKTILLAFAS